MKSYQYDFRKEWYLLNGKMVGWWDGKMAKWWNISKNGEMLLVCYGDLMQKYIVRSNT